jgi:NAD dependent epimerase/dehydratase family enzyme
MNWVHVDDLCNIFSFVIDNQITGTFNIVGGTNTNKEFTHTLAKVLKKPLLLPNIPAFVLKIILGELSELLLNGNYVSGEKLKSTGFHYEHTDLEESLRSIYLL